jgi:hypothetical protein
MQRLYTGMSLIAFPSDQLPGDDNFIRYYPAA